MTKYDFVRLIIAGFILSGITFPQEKYSDLLKEQSIYSNASELIKGRKSFMREWWFYEQRAYPDETIPPNAYLNSLEQRQALREYNNQLVLSNQKDSLPSFNWVSLGPTSGGYFGYNYISGRVVTGAFDPQNSNTIYIGPANGGVWKSTDSGNNWMPLTDQEVSMAMGAIEIDPVNPNIIYAGTGEATYSGASYYGRGLLKSTNGGQSWTNITSGLPTSTYFSRLKIRPGNSAHLLAALGNGGLYRSTNSGLNWTQILSGRIDDVVFSPSGDTAFAIGGANGLRRSINGGASFSNFGTGLTTGTRSHFDLAKSNPAYMYVAVYSTTVTLYKSTDYGASWITLSTTSGFQNQTNQAWYDLYVRVNPKNPLKVYVGTIDIYRAIDGLNFVNITNGYAGGNVHVDQHFLFFHPTLENTFIVCNDGGVWKTSNNGDTFSNLNQNLTLTQFYRIAASPFLPSRILGGTQDNGTQQTFSTLNWTAAYGGDGGVVCFNPFNSNFILGETQNGGLFRTTNGGSSWSSSTSGITMSESVAWVAPIIVHPVITDVFFTARQKIYKSTNNGATWTAISGNVNGTSAVREMAISKSRPDILFASSGTQIFKSSDGGLNWTNVTSGLPNRTITSIHISPINSDEVFLTFSGFGTNKIYKSSNGGSSWGSISGNLPDSPVNDLYVHTTNPGYPNTFFAATDIGVFVTENNGTNWFEISTNMPNTVVMHFDYSPGNQMLRAATHGRGVYEAFVDFSVPVELVSFTAKKVEKKILLNWRTATETNNSHFILERKFKNQDWENVSTIAGAGTLTDFRDYYYEDDYSLIAYTGDVLYKLKQVDFSGAFDYSEIISVNTDFMPDRISVSQNFPNPFNSSTTIRYWLTQESNIKITLFNSLGEEIEIIENITRGPGIYQIIWDASNFASGTYFYSFETRDAVKNIIQRDIKKIILLR